MITRPSHGLTVASIKIDPEICRFEFSHHSGVGATAGFLLSFTQPFGVIKLLGREGASNFFKVFKSQVGYRSEFIHGHIRRKPPLFWFSADTPIFGDLLPYAQANDA